MYRCIFILTFIPIGMVMSMVCHPVFCLWVFVVSPFFSRFSHCHVSKSHIPIHFHRIYTYIYMYTQTTADARTQTNTNTYTQHKTPRPKNLCRQCISRHFHMYKRRHMICTDILHLTHNSVQLGKTPRELIKQEHINVCTCARMYICLCLRPCM